MSVKEVKLFPLSFSTLLDWINRQTTPPNSIDIHAIGFQITHKPTKILLHWITLIEAVQKSYENYYLLQNLFKCWPNSNVNDTFFHFFQRRDMNNAGQQFVPYPFFFFLRFIKIRCFLNYIALLNKNKNSSSLFTAKLSSLIIHK